MSVSPSRDSRCFNNNPVVRVDSHSSHDSGGQRNLYDFSHMEEECLDDDVSGHWNRDAEQPRRRSSDEDFANRNNFLNVVSAKHRNSLRALKGILKGSRKGSRGTNSNNSKDDDRSVSFRGSSDDDSHYTLSSCYEQFKRSASAPPPGEVHHDKKRKQSMVDNLRSKSVLAMREFISPTQTPTTIKIFGSPVEVELERRRTFEKGITIHPLSRFLFFLIYNCFVLL